MTSEQDDEGPRTALHPTPMRPSHVCARPACRPVGISGWAVVPRCRQKISRGVNVRASARHS